MINFQYVLESLDTEEQRMTAELIFENYKNMMYHTAYSVLHQREDAEDAVMASLIKLCRNMDIVMKCKANKLPGLVYTCVKNMAIDHYREKERKEADSLDAMEYDAVDEDSDPFNNFDDFGELQEYVEKLSDKQKNVILLRYSEGLKNREIARLLDIPESTVATQIERALKKLKKMYLEDGNKNGKKQV